MEYRVFNAEGRHVAGDAVLDEVVKAAAMLVDGWVEDDKGNVVHTSPGRRAALEAEAEAERKRAEEDQAAADAAAPVEEERDEPESLTGVVTPPEEE